MALFKSMDEMANTAGTMFPGTIVPIPLELLEFQTIIVCSQAARGHILHVRHRAAPLDRRRRSKPNALAYLGGSRFVMDTKPIRDEMIRSHLASLQSSLHFVLPVDDDELRALYDARDYTAMVKFIRDTMKLDLRVRVEQVNDGGRANAPAWVSTPSPMPRYGTPEYRAALVTVSLRKSFLQESTFENVVMAIAHELSHVVLNGIGHALREHEEAVDLTAMLLGFRDFYFTGSEYVEVKRGTYQSLGYLTPEEVRYAATILTRPIGDVPRTAPIAKQPRFAPGLTIFFGLLVVAAGAIWLVWIEQGPMSGVGNATTATQRTQQMQPTAQPVERAGQSATLATSSSADMSKKGQTKFKKPLRPERATDAPAGPSQMEPTAPLFGYVGASK